MSDFLLRVLRGPSSDVGTFSAAVLSDGVRPSIDFDIIELPWRANKPNLSCIQVGTYQASVVKSIHFGFDVYLLRGIPGRSNIELHPANWAGDTTLGWYSDLLGCMSPGYEVGELAAPNGKLQKAVMHSTDAFKELMNFTGGAPLTVQIIGFGQVGG